MQVAYVRTTCPCGDGLEHLVWDPEHGARAALAHETPGLASSCGTCGGTGHVRVAVSLDHEPVEPLTESEMDALLAERIFLREEIALEELTRPYVWPDLMQRHDDLRVVEQLRDLDGEIATLEQTGVLVTPGLLQRREELRARARELLPAAA